MIRTRLLAGAAALALAIPVAVSARPAVTTKAVHLRAGPGRDYRVVAVLPTGMVVDVQGCIAGLLWCDVEAVPERGWVYAGNLAWQAGGGDVPLLAPGVAAGVPMIIFLQDQYWPLHYADRPWYPYHHHRPPRPHPPPRGEPPPRGPPAPS